MSKRLLSRAAGRPASDSQGDDATPVAMPYHENLSNKLCSQSRALSKSVREDVPLCSYTKPKRGVGEFKALFAAVPGVAKMEWQTAITPRRNNGDRYAEQNLFAYSSRGARFRQPAHRV